MNTPEQPSPFAPFQPVAPAPVPTAPTTTKKKRSGSKKPAKNSVVVTPTEMAKITKAFVAPRQKRRKVAPQPARRAPRFELQTILKVAAELKEADMPVFKKTLGLLQDASKATRERVLSALGKVFG